MRKKEPNTKRGGRKRVSRPALTPESRENQLIELAIDVAEQQLRDGTASSQIIAHYLKLGSTRDRLERENLRKQGEYIDAKTEAIKSIEKDRKLYEDAIEAMRSYSGISKEG